jgi:hypothetical protein
LPAIWFATVGPVQASGDPSGFVAVPAASGPVDLVGFGAPLGEALHGGLSKLVKVS